LESNNLRIHLVQNAAVWNDPQASLLELDFLLSTNLTRDSRGGLLVLPEMFAQGFVTNLDIVNLKDTIINNQERTLDWMKKTAQKYGIVVVGSLPMLEGGFLYNRMYMVHGNMQFNQFYDKKHLFSLAGEHLHFSPGSKRVCWEYNGWSMMPSICYDLRFPVWLRNQKDYQVILCVANWPKSRSLAWRSLLVARAIENQAYIVGVNRVGTDGTGTVYEGSSMVVGPDGAILVQMGDQKGLCSVGIDAHVLAVFRRAYPFLADADNFRFNPPQTHE
jgi:predicted amidohydrolase